MPPRKADKPDPETPETTEGETPDEPQETGSGDGKVTLGSLDDRLDRLESIVTNFIKGAPKQAAPDTAADVAAQVREETKKIKAADEADRTKKELADRVAALEETAPREYRRITTLLWGSDE